MKKRFLLLLPALAGISFGLSTDWWTIDGGGESSTGGTYAVKGTIGQPDPGAMSGGTYTLEGGFWASEEPYQVSSSPPLTVTRIAGGGVRVSWPAASPGWVLEKSANLVNWAPAGVAPVLQTGMNTVTLPSPPAREFYRLTGP